MSMCRIVSCVVGRGFCYDQCVLLAKLLLAIALLQFVLQGQICLLAVFKKLSQCLSTTLNSFFLKPST